MLALSPLSLPCMGQLQANDISPCHISRAASVASQSGETKPSVERVIRCVCRRRRRSTSRSRSCGTWSTSTPSSSTSPSTCGPARRCAADPTHMLTPARAHLKHGCRARHWFIQQRGSFPGRACPHPLSTSLAGEQTGAAGGGRSAASRTAEERTQMHCRRRFGIFQLLLHRWRNRCG